MSVVKNIIFVFFVFLISNCSFNTSHILKSQNNYYVEIETPNDRYSTYLGENLKRLFFVKDNLKEIYILKTDIIFQSIDTLSINGNNSLKSTKAKIRYELINKKTNRIIKSGSIITNPALSATSSSFYSQQKSIEHIKERLVKNSAKSLFVRINIILRKLS